ILELPQETADSAAQMRRVIVDQIEALAELNRIVARHGRGLDAAEPPRREPALVGSSSRGMDAPRPAPVRGPIPPMMPPPRRRAQPPPLTPGRPPGTGRTGAWRAECRPRAPRREAPAGAPRADERPARHTLESLDSLSVDIARMIDHDAAAELWDRYKRGER